jgi:hypothetical protein
VRISCRELPRGGGLPLAAAEKFLNKLKGLQPLLVVDPGKA